MFSSIYNLIFEKKKSKLGRYLINKTHHPISIIFKLKTSFTELQNLYLYFELVFRR